MSASSAPSLLDPYLTNGGRTIDQDREDRAMPITTVNNRHNHNATRTGLRELLVRQLAQPSA
jgi:hypothetical protein